MRSIASRLKHQQLRKLYPCGVNISPLTFNSEGDIFYITNLKNGVTFHRGMVAKDSQGNIIRERDAYASMMTQIMRSYLIEAFEEAGVHVTKRHLSDLEHKCGIYESKPIRHPYRKGDKQDEKGPDN